jgi:hypothetical protein
MLTKLKCLANFGFCSNPSYTLQKNFNIALKNENTSPLSTQPNNLTFHNLACENKLPLGTKQLLGLNLKFCIATNPLKNNIAGTVRRMARSIRTTFYLKSIGHPTDREYAKQIYVNIKNWNPPPAPLIVEEKLTEFEKELKNRHQQLLLKYRHRNLRNLTPLQQNITRLLKDNKNIIIKPTDKNLGPAILDTKLYITQVLKEHLLTDSYKQLSKDKAKIRMDDLRTQLKNLINENKNKLTTSELTYFQRSLLPFLRLPIFYGLPKIHKTPMSLRPVVSTCGSLLSIFSNWLDFKMKDLLPFVKSYLKNSITVIDDLKKLQIPENALLFSADAKSMYTNIDTDVGLTSIKKFIDDNKDSISPNFPTDLFLATLEIVMKNNIFTFADTYWLQLTGTAMGTPVACSYATITYGQHENTSILTKFQPQLLYYRRYIDDIFGIWLPSPTNNNSTWNQFKAALNNWGTLEWVIDTPSHQTVFLDLNISLHNSTITTSTFQKNLNLYLYIPPKSAHPPSCLKGLIAGELRRYWLQNNTKDFIAITTKFLERLTERGHQLDKLTPIFQQAAATLDLNLRSTPDIEPDPSTLFIHWEYHPNGIQRKDIRSIYSNILAPHLDYNKMTVAISRPKNLRDILSKSHLTTPPNITVQGLIDDLHHSGTIP